MVKPVEIYAPDEEAQRKYQEALDRVTASLDARKNRLFDPTLLAMAEGFLAPTRTGGFGESLGMAARNIRGAEEARFKEEQELAQAQLGLAQQGMQLERQRQMAKAYEQALNPPGAPAVGPAPMPSGPAGGGAPVPMPAGPAGLSGGAGASMPTGPEGFQIAPPQPLSMNRTEFLRGAQLAGKPIDQALKEWDEYSRKQRETKEGGVFDYGSGRFFPVPKAEQVNIQLRGYQGTFPVSQEDAMRLAALERAGDSAGYKALADRIVKGPKGTSRIASAEEMEQEKIRGKGLAEEETKTEAELRREIVTRGDQAGGQIRTANQLLAIAEDPAAERMLGILSNQKYSSAIAKLIETGVGIPGFSIGIPEIQNVLRNLNLSPAEIAKYQYAAMLIAQQRLDMTKYMKGAVSDFEQRLMGSASMTTDDTPAAIKMKSQAIIARGQFERQVARLWERSKGQYRSVSEFKQSDEYDKLVSEYDAKLAKLLETMPVPGQQSRPGKPTSPPIRFQKEGP